MTGGTGGFKWLPIDISDTNEYNDIMSSLNVRRLPDAVAARLRVRAARAGRSMEAEAREILTATCAKSARPITASELQRFVDQLYVSSRPTHVVADLIAERRREGAKE